MLVTISGCWWRKRVGDWFEILKTLCCWLISVLIPRVDVGDHFYILVSTSISWWNESSSRSQRCHQRIFYPTSVTNIDGVDNCVGFNLITVSPRKYCFQVSRHTVQEAWSPDTIDKVVAIVRFRFLLVCVYNGWV